MRVLTLYHVLFDWALKMDREESKVKFHHKQARNWCFNVCQYLKESEVQEVYGVTHHSFDSVPECKEQTVESHV